MNNSEKFRFIFDDLFPFLKLLRSFLPITYNFYDKNITPFFIEYNNLTLKIYGELVKFDDIIYVKNLSYLIGIEIFKKIYYL